MALTTQALILESNGETYFRGNNVLKAGNNVGLLAQVPTPDGGGTNEGDFWAFPVNNEDVVTSIGFIPYNLLNNSPSTQPVPYAVPATKIRVQGVNNIGKQDYYFVLGTSAQWAAAALPDQSALVYWPTSQHAQPITGTDGIVINGQFKFTLGVPSLAAGQFLFPKGWFNGTALPAASAGGYSTIAALLTFLNTNWNTMGSPALSVVWTATTNNSAVVGVFTDTATDIYDVEDAVVLDAFVWAITP